MTFCKSGASCRRTSEKSHSISTVRVGTQPYSSPVVIILNESSGIRLTINYNKLNDSILGQLPTPRIDEVLDKLGSGRMFPLFDLISSIYQIVVHKDTIPLTAFCTPTRLFEWLVMPQGSSAALGRLCLLYTSPSPRD